LCNCSPFFPSSGISSTFVLSSGGEINTSFGVLGRLRLCAREETELLRLGRLATLLTLPESILLNRRIPLRSGITTPGAASPRRENRGVTSYGAEVSQLSPDSRGDDRGRVDRGVAAEPVWDRVSSGP
jgi:hypothetical protein